MTVILKRLYLITMNTNANEFEPDHLSKSRQDEAEAEAEAEAGDSEHDQQPVAGTTQPTFHGSRSASHIGRKPAFGQTCSMKTLLQDGILQTGEKVLTLEYEGKKFCGDLRRDGTIMMRGPEGAPHIYATPVAWANHCCRMLNPESKPLNAWSSIRFKGKRLDSYKLKWYRAQKSNKINNEQSANSMPNVLPVNNILDMSNLNAGFVKNLQRSFQQQQLQQQQSQLQPTPNMPTQQGGSRLMIHNPITNYFPQYENPLKNMKLIKSVLISSNMDLDCKKLVAKSLDQSIDPCTITSQINEALDKCSDNDDSTDNNDVLNGDTEMAQDGEDAEQPATTNGKQISENGVDGNEENQDVKPAQTKANKTVKNYCSTLRTTVINYEQLGTRGPHNTHNPNTMVKCIPFSAVDRIQPFNVTISTNALLLVDFHSHLVDGEVAGYLAGTWDAGQHILTITQAFPCRVSLDENVDTAAIENEIRQDIEKRQLTLVGWYHSHQGKYSNYPTIMDIQSQMEYQITMKEAPGGYIPCVGLICSPHDIRSEDDVSPSFQIYWVMPPPEHLGNHYGRPMQMYYSVTRDLFLTQDLLLEMRLLANFYTSNNTNMVNFESTYEYNNKITKLDKLSGSIKPKLPKDLQESEYPDEPNIWKAAIDHFWKFLKNLVIPQTEEELKVEEEQKSSDDQNETQEREEGIST